jgi:hypothetical protein
MAADGTAGSPRTIGEIQRLGKNQGRYLGETIEIKALLHDIQLLALKDGWQKECFLDQPNLCLVGYHRPLDTPRARLYLSAGIHGDEPAGPNAIRELLRARVWPEGVEVWMCPCLNPSGFPLNTRENALGIDLNRQYLHLEAEETRAHVRWLHGKPQFDLALCLHEDWESQGFYVYELNLSHRPSFAEAIVRRVAEVCPIDRSPVIEGREAQNGIIRPSSDPTSRPQWPEAFYLIKHKTQVSYTLEAPSDFPLQVRVAALVAGVRAVLDAL